MRQAIEHWLGRHCSTVDGTALGAVLLRRGEGLHTAALWPAGSALAPAAAAAGTSALAAGSRVCLPVDGTPGWWVAQPLQASNVLVGVAVLRIDTVAAPTDARLAALDASAQRFGTSLPGPGPAKPAPTDDSGQVLRIAQQAFDQPSFDDGCVALLAALAAALKADRASLGFRDSGRTRVQATSTGSDVDMQAGAHADIAAAMDEVIDDAASLVFPQREGDAPRIVAAHARLARAQGLHGLCTVPLVQAGRVFGAIVLERSTEPGFDDRALSLAEGVARTVAAWAAAQRRAAAPWHLRLWQGLRQGGHAMGEPGHGRWKLAALAVLALALGSLAVPMRQQITASARLEGKVQRVLTAPGDGYLRQVWVRPGDAVNAGQVLVEFASEELQLERQKLGAELAGEESTLGDALARDDRAKLAVAGARVGELRAQIALLDQRLERSQVTAPFDAVVIQGDLSQSLGAPMKRGDPLLTLAPREGYRAIVEVPDSDIGLVATGQPASLVLTSQPGRALPAQVLRITPMATQVEGRNVFEVEVGITAPGADELRPGMRGVARLDVGDTPVALAWSRDAVAWIRLATWRWIG